MLLVICAPSGAGKTTIIKEILKIFPFFKFSTSATTRKIRKGEKDGVDYYFISRAEFERKIKENEFVEWEKVYDDYYGTLKTEIEGSLSNKSDIILEVEVKGALSIKRLYPEAITIFIEAPMNELIERLRKRNTETEEELKKRTERMEMEFGMKHRFDYVIKNESTPDGIKQCVNELTKILEKYIKFKNKE